jgi:DNA-binding NarL/FixJ family response regulator
MPNSPTKPSRIRPPTSSAAPPSCNSSRYAPQPRRLPYRTPRSARQLEILRLIAQGLTNAAIGERLVVTEGTIKWHVRQILAKTNSTCDGLE